MTSTTSKSNPNPQNGQELEFARSREYNHELNLASKTLEKTDKKGTQQQATKERKKKKGSQ